MPRRPRQIPPRGPLTSQQIQKACYVGSDEHKDRRWWSGLGSAYVNQKGVAARPGKQDTTIYPLVAASERDVATCWVQAALTAGRLVFLEGDKDYPAKIWHRDETGRLWFGRCVNSVLGQYKGWPIDEEERDEIFGRLS